MPITIRAMVSLSSRRQYTIFEDVVTMTIHTFDLTHILDVYKFVLFATNFTYLTHVCQYPHYSYHRSIVCAIDFAYWSETNKISKVGLEFVK